MNLIKWLAGVAIEGVNRLTLSARGSRPAAEQQAVERELTTYSLYHFNACPFCVKVRRAMHRLNLPIELRDIVVDNQHREDLLAQGGRVMVPCLRIDNADGTAQWMYESDDIIAFLEGRFPLSGQASDTVG